MSKKKRAYSFKNRIERQTSQPAWLRLSDVEKARVDEMALRYNKTRAAMLRYLVLKQLDILEAANGKPD